MGFQQFTYKVAVSELAVAVASVPGRSFNPAAGETKVSTANWYIAYKVALALVFISLEAININDKQEPE